MATITKNRTRPNVETIEKIEQPKKLSKAGEWKRKHPNGILTIVDMKAVMK
jgi:hypothetical protein